MIKTIWKPKEEIEYSLRHAKNVAVLSCDSCANLNGTGGAAGIATLMELLKKLGKEIVFSEIVYGLCFEDFVNKALTENPQAISESDVLIMDSCPLGVKAAYLCKPEIPVVGVLDATGGSVFTMQDNSITRRHCMMCGKCVVNFTGGICPISGCPAKSKYGPCKKASEKDDRCVADPNHECVWVEIKKIGDLSALERLHRIHFA